MMDETGSYVAGLATGSTRDRIGEASPGDAVSWGAVIAGGVAAAALSLILLTLGTGLGLSSLTPWHTERSHAGTAGFAAVVWMLVTQILAAGLGGYLAGRLRRRWTATVSDEVHFRDTAHGFLAWAVSTLVSAAWLVSTLASVSHDGAQALASSSPVTAAVAARLSPMQRGDADTLLKSWPAGYLIDGLFRPAAGVSPMLPSTPGSSAIPTGSGELAAREAQVARVFLNSLPAPGALSTEDTLYVAQLVSEQTGIPAIAAQARVTTTYTRLQARLAEFDDAARAAADSARRTAIHAALWLFVSLLVGAFSASYAATAGGRERDR